MIISRIHAVFRGLFGYTVKENLHETAWLDGVRGTAAFLVLLNHYNMEWATYFVEAPWYSVVTGTNKADGVNYHHDGDVLWAPWRLPILRVIVISGSAQVAVFFVLSGMVLSWSPVKAIRAGNLEKLQGSLSSSVIRRWFRLFLPCFVVGIFHLVHVIYWDYHGLGGVVSELGKYFHAMEQWSNPFQTAYTIQMSTNNPYNFIMWTIPFEYGGSCATYFALMGLSRMPHTLTRMIIVLLISTLACFKKVWAFWLFGFGIALSDYVQAHGGPRKLSQSTSRASNIFWWCFFVLALLVMGWTGPSDNYTIPGYEWTTHIPIPDGYRGFVGEDRFWHGWGAIMLLLSANHLRLVQRFYELGFIQYLGRISFMLYLIHFWMNIVVSQPIRHRIYEWLCVKEYDESFESDVFRTTRLFNIGVHIVLMLITVPLVFILSNHLEIWVDRPCTNFGKWLDGKLTGIGANRNEKMLPEEHQLLPMTSDERRTSQESIVPIDNRQ